MACDFPELRYLPDPVGSTLQQTGQDPDTALSIHSDYYYNSFVPMAQQYWCSGVPSHSTRMATVALSPGPSLGTRLMATGAPSHSPMVTGAPSRFSMAAGVPSHSPMAVGAPSRSSMAAGVPS